MIQKHSSCILVPTNIMRCIYVCYLTPSDDSLCKKIFVTGMMIDYELYDL